MALNRPHRLGCSTDPWDVAELGRDRIAHETVPRRPDLDPTALVDQHLELAARLNRRMRPGTSVEVLPGGTVVTRSPRPQLPPWTAAPSGGDVPLRPRTAHEVIQLRKLRLISQREARRMLGLPVR